MYEKEILALGQELSTVGGTLHTYTRPDGGGVVVYFDNGYCADVAINRMTYGHEQGLYEIAVMTHKDYKDLQIVYDTPITDDVLGFLNLDEVVDYVIKIRELPNRVEQ